MNPKDLINLQEAYLNIYQQQDLDENIEIASEYFYAQGLNEDGIDILIDELGEERFAEFVCDIVEDFLLFEARRSGRIEPITTTGKSIGSLKGAPKTSAIRRLKGEKERQRQSERETSASSGMTAALRKQAMTAAASKQKPTPKKEEPTQTKQGIGGAVGSVLGYIGKRAREDMASVGRTMRTARQAGREAEQKVADVGRVARKAATAVGEIPDIRRARRAAQVAAGRAGQAAGRVARRVPGAAGAAIGSGVAAHRQGKTAAQIAGRVAGTAVRKLTAKEEFEIYNSVLEYLIYEGYVDTFDSAEMMLESISDQWLDEILENL